MKCSEFYDMTNHDRLSEDIAREHRRRREHEPTVETIDLGALLLVGAFIVALWLVL